MRVLVLLFVLVAGAWAQAASTAAQVVDFVRRSVKTNSDKELAESLKKFTLSDRFTDDAVEKCVQAGVGPKTRSALFELLGSSASLPVTKKPVVASSEVAKPAGPPPPSAEEIAKVIEKVTEYARGYIKNLPNFTCTQRTKRYFDTGRGEHFQLEDTLVENLSYLEGQESYKVVSVNNTPTTKSHWELGGTQSAGEFGSDMAVLFDPNTHTEFTWDSWTTWGGRRTHRFAYRVLQSNSSWTLEYEKTQRTVPGYKGFIYVDRDVNMIMRITREAVDIPLDFPIQSVKQDTRYTFQTIGESQREYLVPATSMNVSKVGRYMKKNDIEFRLYRKFGTESVFRAESADEPLPKKQDY